DEGQAPVAGATEAAEPGPGARGGRGDPRRDGPDEGPAHDVVRLGRAAAAAAATIARRSSQPPAPSQPPGDPDPSEPSVIVDMGGNIESVVRDLMLSGPDDDATVTQRVLTQGEAVLPVLVQHFPGPLWFDRHQPHRRLPAGRDVSPVARALAAFGELAVPYIASLLGSRHGDTRFYALLLAHDFLHPDLIEPVGAMVFDPDDGVRTVALRVLPRFPRGAAYDKLLESLRIFGRVPRKSPRARAQAVEALGPLHDVGALDLLIDLLEADEAPTVEAAHRSLVALTRHDLGTSKRRWASWADKNRHRHRIEWLIDALTLADASLHSAAGTDLQQITQQYFGYHPSMSKHEREVVQQRYRDWWQNEGRATFAGA
ncbi:MAG: HEAT repeat domain-containing protein, partial [Myxococcota bacterium]